MEQRELQTLVEETSNQFFNRRFVHQARFNNRLKTTGGRYLLQTHDIELNPKYYEEQGMDVLIGIIKHELCHYHLHLQKRGYKHRDREFRELLEEVGAPRFCTPLYEQKPKFIHFYQCMSCQQMYKRKRKMNTEKYVCGKCRGKLKKIEEAID